MTRRIITAAAVLGVLAAAGCNDAVRVRGVVTKGGKPFGPADGETMILNLNTPTTQYRCPVRADGTFALADYSDLVPPGSYRASVTLVRQPSAAPPSGGGGKTAKSQKFVPTRPPEVTGFPGGDLMIEPGRAGGYEVTIR